MEQFKLGNGCRAGEVVNTYKNMDHITELCCDNGTCKVDTRLVPNLKKYTWYMSGTTQKNVGYFAAHLNDEQQNELSHAHTSILLHQLVMYLNNEPIMKDKSTIDHINRDHLDNRFENLRWATQAEQNMNTDRRVRKYNAKELPEGILHEHLPKWVTYNKEIYNKETGATREFFRIEKHPTLKNWWSSKSNKVSIQDKLAETYKKLEEAGEDPFEHPVMKFKYTGSEKPDYVKVYNKDPNVLATDGDFVLKRDTIPKYVNFVKETDRRGCKFEIAVPGQKRWSTSGSKKVSLADKYDAMLLKRNAMDLQ